MKCVVLQVLILFFRWSWLIPGRTWVSDWTRSNTVCQDGIHAVLGGNWNTEELKDTSDGSNKQATFLGCSCSEAIQLEIWGKRQKAISSAGPPAKMQLRQFTCHSLGRSDCLSLPILHPSNWELLTIKSHCCCVNTNALLCLGAFHVLAKYYGLYCPCDIFSVKGRSLPQPQLAASLKHTGKGICFMVHETGWFLHCQWIHTLRVKMGWRCLLFVR